MFHLSRFDSVTTLILESERPQGKPALEYSLSAARRGTATATEAASSNDMPHQPLTSVMKENAIAGPVDCLGVEAELVKSQAPLKIVAIVWLAIVIAGTVRMITHSGAPGTPGAPPSEMPLESGISLTPGVPTLVMFAHPHCPCTRASVGELAKLVAISTSPVNTHVFFVKPAGTAADWEKSDLWRTAAAIPGVTIHADQFGEEAFRFRSQTSGDIALYDSRGHLQFHGGITIARGHAGDSLGRIAIENLLGNVQPKLVETPVFGCSLFSSPSQEFGAE